MFRYICIRKQFPQNIENKKTHQCANHGHNCNNQYKSIHFVETVPYLDYFSISKKMKTAKKAKWFLKSQKTNLPNLFP